MKTSTVTPKDIARSVWAVPPLALNAEGVINGLQNNALAAHMEAGGISTILWGGNANIYAMTEAEFANLASAIPDWVSGETWAIPSAGPDHGKLRAHADALRGRGYPAALLLPYSGPGDAAGREDTIRAFVDRAVMPAILYIKSADYLAPDRIAALIKEGVVAGLKYAVETGDLSVDPYLEEILRRVERDKIVSGIGEIAAIPHLSTFGLAGFTAGAVCIAPRRAMAILRALQTGDVRTARAFTHAIEPLEALRGAHGPIPVLHAAVAASGLVEMGTLGPHFGSISGETLKEITAAVQHLMAREADLVETV